MTTLQSFEDKAKAEFGVVIGFIAAHPKTSVIVALVLGVVLGRLGFPWLI